MIEFITFQLKYLISKTFLVIIFSLKLVTIFTWIFMYEFDKIGQAFEVGQRWKWVSNQTLLFERSSVFTTLADYHYPNEKIFIVVWC